MTEKRWTLSDMATMSDNEYQVFQTCVDVHAWRLLGIEWHKRWFFEVDINGDYVLRYA